MTTTHQAMSHPSKETPLSLDPHPLNGWGEVAFSPALDPAYAHLLERAGQLGFSVFEIDAHTLEIWHHASERVFFVTYDRHNGQVLAIQALDA